MTRFYCDICKKPYLDADTKISDGGYRERLKKRGVGAVTVDRLEIVCKGEKIEDLYGHGMDVCPACQDKLDALVAEFVKSHGA